MTTDFKRPNNSINLALAIFPGGHVSVQRSLSLNHNPEQTARCPDSIGASSHLHLSPGAARVRAQLGRLGSDPAASQNIEE